MRPHFENVLFCISFCYYWACIDTSQYT